MLLELAAVVAFTLALWFTGRPLARWALGPGRDAEEIVLAFTISATVVPALAMAIALIWGVLLGPVPYLAAALVLFLLPHVLPVTRHGPAHHGLGHIPPPGHIGLVALALAAGIFLLYMTVVRDIPTPMEESYWQTCTQEAMYHAMGLGRVTWLASSVIEHPGSVYYYPRAPEPLPTVDRSLGVENTFYLTVPPRILPDNFLAYGRVATKDQRLGNTAIFGLFVTFLGIFGVRYAFSLFGALICSWGYIITRRLFGDTLTPLLAFPVLGLGLLDLSFVYLLTDPLFAFVLSASVLHIVLFERGVRPALVAGLLLGMLLGVRDVSVLLVPAALYALAGQRRWRAAVIALAIGALLSALPWLYWHQYAYGTPFTTEAVTKHTYIEPFDYSILGVDFRLPVLMNWPLHDSVVRTPVYPFPVFVLLPLVVAATLGWPLVAMVLPGLKELVGSDRRALKVLIIWVLPLWIFLSVQENWNEPRMGLLLLVMPALTAVALGGLRRAYQWPELVAVGLVAIVTFAAVVQGYDVPPDPRWSKVNRIITPPDPDELTHHKLALTSPHLLPLQPADLEYDPIAVLAELGAAGPSRRIEDLDCYRPRFNVDTSDIILDLRSGGEGPWRFSLLTTRWTGTPLILPGPVAGSPIIIFGTGAPGTCTLLHLDASVVDGELVIEVRALPGTSCHLHCGASLLATSTGALRILPGEDARTLVLRTSDGDRRLTLSQAA